ncbi:MAG: mannonate dehydratase [Candidatus Latescibacterota bacterium]|nr:mannonate dehydratase [Candidatus Latescibacterota bacterium]
MYIQDQLGHAQVTDENLAFFAAIGVDCLTINPPPFAPMHQDDSSRLETLDEMVGYLTEVKKQAEGHGLQLTNIALTGVDEISLAWPGRDRAIEQWCDVLRAMAEVGVPTMGWNFKPIGNFRTTSAVGRGGARYSTFDYDEWERTKGEWPDKQIDEASMWANIQYFLDRIVPVAEESGVRLALHPDDPPIAEAMGGAMRIVSTLEQYERIFEMAPSDCNAMLFCQGCVTEMGVDVYDAIRRIGRQNKIVYVHFRNVKGSLRYFEEVFIDEGDVDMLKALQTYKEVGFEGPFMMDHTPSIPGDLAGKAGHALATGYMRAMIQTVYRE